MCIAVRTEVTVKCILLYHQESSKLGSLFIVFSGEYFPQAYNDTVSVWEDESIAFNALENDFFAGDNASIL